MAAEFNAESPVIWRDNLKFADEDIEKVSSLILADEEFYNDTSDSVEGSSIHTTYHAPPDSRPELLFLESYKEVISEIVLDLGLYECDTKFNYWCQIYDGGHENHFHLNALVPVSFVHFVRPTETKCFYFVTRDLERLYPKQDPGDIIAFSSWTPHGVDQSIGNARMTIAGNIVSNMMRAPGSPDYQIPREVRKGLYITEHLQD